MSENAQPRQGATLLVPPTPSPPQSPSTPVGRVLANFPTLRQRFVSGAAPWVAETPHRQSPAWSPFSLVLAKLKSTQRKLLSTQDDLLSTKGDLKNTLLDLKRVDNCLADAVVGGKAMHRAQCEQAREVTRLNGQVARRDKIIAEAVVVVVMAAVVVVICLCILARNYLLAETAKA